MRVTALSACPWLAHLVSCPIHATQRPIQTRFRFAFGCISLMLATCIDSLAHSPKGTPSGYITPPTGCKHTVSGSFHSPRRGSFHLSLTVLLRYRSSNVFSLRQWAAYLHTELACSVLLSSPLLQSHTGLSPSTVGLPRPFCFAFFEGGFSAFARHYSPNLLFSSGYLDVSVPRVPFRERMIGCNPYRVSPFGHPRLLRLYTPHRGFSQCITSFFGI